MAHFGRFMVSNTGSRPKAAGVGAYPGGVRVYLAGRLIGSVEPSSRDPLGYIRMHKGSRYRHALVALLTQHGATQGEIDAILDGDK
jgi:hypothetical protein